MRLKSGKISNLFNKAIICFLCILGCRYSSNNQSPNIDLSVYDRKVLMVVKKISDTSVIGKFTCNFVEKVLNYQSEMIDRGHMLIILTVFSTENKGPYVFNGAIIEEIMTIEDVNSLCPHVYYVYSIDCGKANDFIICTHISLTPNMMSGLDTIYFYSDPEPWDLLNVCKFEVFALDDRFEYYRPRSRLNIECKVISSVNELKSLL